MTLKWWMLVTVNLLKSVDCTSIVNPDLNYGCWAIMICQCRFISCNECTTLVAAFEGGAGLCVCEGRGCMGTPCTFLLNFAMTLKLILKKKGPWKQATCRSSENSAAKKTEDMSQGPAWKPTEVTSWENRAEHPPPHTVCACNGRERERGHILEKTPKKITRGLTSWGMDSENGEEDEWGLCWVSL